LTAGLDEVDNDWTLCSGALQEVVKAMDPGNDDPATDDEADTEAIPKDLTKDLATLRKEYDNTFCLVADLMLDRDLQITGRMICTATNPYRKDYADYIAAHKTQLDSARWAAAKATGSWRTAVRRSVETCSDPKVLERFGMCPGAASTTTTIAEPAKRSWAAEEVRLSKSYLAIVVELASARSWSMAPHSDCLPGLGAGVLSADARFRQLTATQLKLICIVILKAEGFVFNEDLEAPKDLEALLKDLTFNKWQSVRELMAIGFNCDFDYRDRQLNEWAWSLYAGISNTKFFLEDVFSNLRDVVQRRQKNNVVSRWDKLFYAINTPQLRNLQLPQNKVTPEEWIENPPPGNNRLKCADGENLNDNVFCPGVARHQVDPALKPERLTTPGRKAWKPAGPAGNHRSAAAMACLLCDADNDFANVHKAWCGSLAGLEQRFGGANTH